MSEFKDRYGPWAVVTGASAGIGEEFARQLAARGLNLVLVARRGEKLEALARELRGQHGIEVRPQPVDLTRQDFIGLLREGTRDLHIGLLVNNAGAWVAPAPFLENNLEDELSVIDLNVRAPAVLAHEFGTRMAQRGRGGIIFLSSIVAYQGTPFSGNYAASKAYDLHLAEALAYELKDQGVDVLALSPGPTATEGTADLDMSVLPLPVLSVGPVVANALQNLGRRSATIPGVMNNVMNLVGKLVIPRALNTRMMGYLFGQMVSVRNAGAGGAAQNPLRQQES